MAARLLRHPGFWLLVAVLAGLVNQMFFSVYAAREPQRVAALASALPPGWFDLVAPPAWLDRLVPRSPLLALAALRVQAGIELPFTMLAYLVVCRWFGADVFGRALRSRWLASAAWTATFCLVEMWLPTPYTAQDVAVRIVSGLIAPALLGALRPDGRRGAGSFGSFALSAAALGGLVLVVYDVVLLYNLGHARAAAPAVGALAVVLGFARAWAARGSARPGPAVGALVAAFGEFLVLFFVPALPIRYGFVVGHGALAAALGLGVVAASVWRAEAYRAAHLVAAGAGFVVGFVCLCAPARYVEVRLLLAAAGFLGAAWSVCRISDSRQRSTGAESGAESSRPATLSSRDR
ncbi:hypothetical protein [Segniliparus rugosus]|uniref:Uncharacterized protein n=1 Tax=Segniliparus rugosus (strain ATCC BAA-974 / DSM 45345 / CCUG 50838 / CIP 108380 / JCM 13579 / CDC 945) TaxID=679197 RepID=E5XVH4_SEGRC|nr:hypothetical protein [Segniliparus rugosus]EFV11652.2 hypothetical protein HMPREF9336_03496 [Segniliparus rugosus ATCC BAA-974]